MTERTRPIRVCLSPIEYELVRAWRGRPAPVVALSPDDRHARRLAVRDGITAALAYIDALEQRDEAGR